MVIYSKRCTIRPFEECDINDFMTYRNDMDWMKYQGFKGLEKEEYKDVLLGNFSLDNGVQLAIVCNNSNRLIGDIYIKKDKEEGVLWIGYTICRWQARQGYAYESVLAVIDALKTMGITNIKAGVEAENFASIALLKKLKFQYLKRDEDEEIYILNLD